MANSADHSCQSAPAAERESKHGLGGRVVAGGAATRQALTKLLGIDRAAGGFRITAAAWMDHALEVAVTDEANKIFVFRIERRTPESCGLVLTPDLNIYARGSDAAVSLTRAVAAVAARRLADWTTNHLAAMLERDPESGKPGTPMPPAPDEEKRPRSLLDTWGAEDSYADFFAGGEISRGQLDSIDPSKLFQFVQHCDNECLFVNPHSIGTIVSLVNYPWDERVRSPARPSEQGLATLSDAAFVEEGMVTTDLIEDDVILGNPQKLRDLLAYAVSRPNPENKLLFVSNTCVPTVIGEDVESVVKRLRKETGKPILYLTVTPRSMTNVFQGLLVDRRLAAEQAAQPAPTNSVNLIGFPGPQAAKELCSLLESAGIHVNVRLLPDLNTDLVDHLPHGALNIFYPNQLWQHLYDQLLDRSRIPGLVLQAPFGFEATKDWLQQLALAINSELVCDDAWKTHVTPWEQKWQSLKARAMNHRLGFVLRDSEAYFLTTPASTWGVPLVSVIEEMGFGIDVLIRVSEPKLAKEAARSVRALFKDGSRHSVRAFDSFGFLRQRLKDCPADAFLSYHFFDWRLTEAGKSSFSIQHFELGVPGAVRTLERLLAVCETRYYQRYGKYLSRTPEGLRETPALTRRSSP